MGCWGCFNPATHAFAGGELLAVEDLFQRLVALGGTIEGLTVSGGEPFQQRRALLALLQRLRQETTLSVLVFTGFTWDEILRLPKTNELLACIDVLIAGRYDHTQHLARDLRGSANKTVHPVLLVLSNCEITDFAIRHRLAVAAKRAVYPVRLAGRCLFWAIVPRAAVDALHRAHPYG
jgi:organic radical activating enzyme